MTRSDFQPVRRRHSLQVWSKFPAITDRDFHAAGCG